MITKIKKQFLCLLLILVPTLFFGQIHISNKVKESTISSTQDNALYFIDFWATWCGPCIHVSKYLESLQRQFPEKFYILSLTQESKDVVDRFMTKHDIGLAVAIDYEGETFAENNITSLPFGILFNAEGKKLWEGHAADLKSYDIARYLRTNKTTISINDFFDLEAYKQAEIVVETEEKRKKSFKFLELDINSESTSGIQMVNKNGYLEIEGHLQDLLAYALHSNKSQIKIPKNINKYYKMYFEEGSRAYENKESYISRALKLKQKTIEKEGEVLVLNINTPNFWDTSQINWGVGNPKYLIGDSDIQADNISLNDMIYQLSFLLETPIVLDSAYEGETLHDWQIHYKYFEFMVSNLDEYGINTEKKTLTYPEYVYRSR